MTIQRIDYLEWISGRPEAVEYDLASSDLATSLDRQERLDRLVQLQRPDPNTTLESLVAAQYDDSISAENVIVTAGATTASVFTLATAMEAHEPDADANRTGTGNPAVVTESPGYEPLSATPRTLNADVQYVQRRASDDYQLSPTAVLSAVTDNTCLVSVTNRHNPSGRLTSKRTLETLATDLDARDVRLLVDEVYAPYAPAATDGPGTALGGVTAAGLDSTVITNSLTKFLGFGDLRIGWAIGDPAFVQRAETARWHAIDVAATSRELARIVFHNIDQLERRSRERVRANAELLRSFVDGRDDLSGFVAPDHTMAFLKHEQLSGDDVAEAASARNVLLVPGRFFGDRTRFRVSLGGDPSVMREGLDVLSRALDEAE